MLKIWQITCLRFRWQGFYLEVFSVTAQQNFQTGKFNFTIVIETCLNFQQLLESGAKTDFTKEQVNCGHNCKIVIFNERAREFSQVLRTGLFSQCFNIFAKWIEPIFAKSRGGVILDCVRWTSDLQWVKFWIKFEPLVQTNHIKVSPTYCWWFRNQPCTFVCPLFGTSLKTSWPPSHHRWATSWTWSIALVLNIHIVPHVIVLFIRGTPSHG